MMADNLQAILERLEPEVRRAFEEAIADIRSAAQLQAVIGHLEAGNVEAALIALNLRAEFFQPLDDALTDAFNAGGVSVLAGLPALPVPFSSGARVVARFDGRNPRAERVARDLSSTLITQIIDDQREAIRAVIEAGIEAGQGPRDTALNIVGRVNKATGKREGGIVGLNAPQTKAWLKAGDELDALDPAYFERKLRDKRFDPMVRKAIETGKPLSKADRERVLNRYSARLLKHRGDTIARTETIASLNAGRDQGIRQLIEAGNITEDQVRKVWDSSGPDGRTRDTHLGMEAQERRLDEPFVTPMGYRLMHPGDASLGAPGSETINCRCVLRFSLDVYRGLK